MRHRVIRTTGAVSATLAALATLSASVFVVAAHGQTPEDRLAELGIELPTPDSPVANYVKVVTAGTLVFVAGHGPCGGLDESNTGKIDRDHSVEEGYAIARWVGVCVLASLKREIGALSRVKRIVRVFGMVNATPEFTGHSQVINGFSDLMEEVFGPEVSKHARAAVGMSSLPRDQSVEVEMVVELHASSSASVRGVGRDHLQQKIVEPADRLGARVVRIDEHGDRRDRRRRLAERILEVGHEVSSLPDPPTG